MLSLRYILVLLALLCPLFAADASAPAGDWKPVEDISDSLVIDIGKFAVYEYHQQHNKDLVFQNVTKASYKDVERGTLYRLVIIVKDYDSNLNPNPVYLATVFRRPFDRFKKLLSFVQISN